MDVYVLPGDATVTGLSHVKAGTKADGQLVKYETNPTSTLTVKIASTDIVNGSVILGFAGVDTTRAQVRISKLVMTRTSWAYDFVPGGDGAAVSTVAAGTPYPEGIGSWTLLKGYTTISLAADHLHGNLGGSSTENRYVALVLNNFPGAGTYEVTVTTPSSNATAMQMWIVPGDATAGSMNVNYIKNNGRKADGTVSETLNTTSVLSVEVEEDDVKDGKIVLAFLGCGLSSTSAKRFRVSGVEFKAAAPKVAQVGDTQYTTVSEAITAAGTNGTVKLIASAEEDTVEIKNGVTLDLNGNTLTGTVVAANGNIIDSATDIATDSTDTTTLGGIVGTVSAPDNTYLPLKDGDTWRFFKYELATYTAYENTAEETVEFWFDIDITNAAGYNLIKSGKSGLTVSAELSWTGTSKATTVSFDSVIAGDNSWANNELTEGEGQEAGMYLSVTGIPAAVTEVTVKPVYSSTDTGLSGAFDAITHEAG